jgi:hypothetical protein
MHLIPPLSFHLLEDPDGQMSAEEEEARRIAEMGKPILGEHSRLEVVIEESYEFKVYSPSSPLLHLIGHISTQ